MTLIKSARWAYANGFRYSGRLYGVPVWVSDLSDTPIICAKNWFFDVLMDIAERFPLNPGAEFESQIRITGEIVTGKRM